MYTTYCTDIKLAYFFNVLEPDILKQIPRSTLSAWKDPNILNSFGIDYRNKKSAQTVEILRLTAQNSSLISFNKTVLLIQAFLIIIFTDNEIKKIIYKKYRPDIIKLIDNVKASIGFSEILKTFNITTHQYKYWKRDLECIASPFSLCRKIFYNQLSEIEVNTIKKYLLNPDFIGWSLISVYYKILRDKIAYFSLSTFYK